jgi:hypothetical protein
VDDDPKSATPRPVIRGSGDKIYTTGDADSSAQTPDSEKPKG